MAIERPEHRWLFIRKVYTILSIQLLLTIAVGALVVTVHPISHFFLTKTAGLVIYITILITIILVLFPLYFYHKKHPWNYILLGVFTLLLALVVGLTCSLTKGKVVLEAAISTAAVFVSLTLYTFWGVKRGHDFKFLGPFLYGAVLLLLLFVVFQIFHPLGRNNKIGATIYGLAASIIFCAYIIYDTTKLIEHYSYDDYIWAAAALYLDVFNMFLAMLGISRATN